MEQTTNVRGMLQPDLSAELLLSAVAIAVVVGVISGLYPGWHSSRLSSSIALHG
jgi:putative ABC transport system permease protein